MPSDLSSTPESPTVAMERRERRVRLPDCASCQLPLHVDVRSTGTLYARCLSCGRRLMVAKPATTGGGWRGA